MNNKSIYTLLIILCVVGFWVFENFYTPDPYTDPKIKGAALKFEPLFLPSSKSGMIINHNYYMLSYSEPHEQAEWVAYQLKQEHLTNDDRRRPYFIEDPQVPTKSADWRNYRGSGFDRGHLCPAGDRRFSEFAYNETFYTSNITPQWQDFNAGVWNRLEQQVRYWCKSFGELHIITGGILENGLEEIGEEDVDVPNYFFKVVIRGHKDQFKVLAFLFPHKESQASLKDFLISIDELEHLTGLDFFEKMDKGEQAKIEASIDGKGWKI